ncbi:MAG: BamA/TamA family outer membrane protein [Bacteroidota bacterium]
MRRHLLTLLIFSFFCVPGYGQKEQPFSQARNWKMLTTDHFDVFFLPKDKGGAFKVGKYAELARFELGIVLDYKPNLRYQLFYAGNVEDLLRSNINTQDFQAGPGNFRLPRHQAQVVDPGASGELYAAVKKAVAQVVLEEFTYTDRISQNIQTQLLFHDATWFKQGLQEYLADGWTFEDEMWINSLIEQKSNLLTNLALEGETALNRLARKSIWHYITHEYGEQKISEIIYLVNISHSIESGVIAVLGITLNTLTYRWREFLRQQAAMAKGGRMLLTENQDALTLPLKDGFDIKGFAYNAARDMYALYLNKGGKHRVFLYDGEEHRYLPTDIQMGRVHHHAAQFDTHLPMAWNGDGTILATTAYYKGQYVMAYFDIENDEITYGRIDPAISQIGALSWAHQEPVLAVSALQNGWWDIYTTEANSASFEAVTRDAYDDLDPTWSMDDQQIVFSSNRDTTGLRIEIPAWEAYQQDFDLYRFEYAEKARELVRITQTPLINERQPHMSSNFEVMVRSDESGIYNLSQVNIFSGEAKALSNLALGFQAFDLAGEEVNFLKPEEGIMRICRIPLQTLIPVDEPAPTLLRLDYLADYQVRVNEEKRRTEQAVAVEEETPAPEDVPETSPSQGAETEAGEDKPVRYYIFDEDDDLYVPEEAESPLVTVEKQKIKTNRLDQTVFGDQPKPTLDEVDLGADVPAQTKWGADYLGINLNYHPIPSFKRGLDMSAGFSDALKNHRVDIRIQPFFNLRNSFSDLSYTYMKGRIDYSAKISHQGISFREANPIQNDSALYRFDRLTLDLGARYPLSNFAAIEIGGGYHYLDRKDQNLIRSVRHDARDNIFRLGANLQFDNTRETDGHTYAGIKVQASFDSYYSLAQQDFNFHRLKGSLNFYQELVKRIVLAGQIKAAFNFPNERIQYYMGGMEDQVVFVEFSNGENRVIRNNPVDTTLYSFHYQDFVMPMRGFLPNTRAGSRYIVSSLELRMPLSRLVKSTLNSGALYNLELIPFVDAGTVWEDGNPFSKKRPTDNQIITTGGLTVRLQTLKSPFLLGVGTGLRTKLLGFSLRTDLAWGIDDNTLQAPVMTISVGKNF